MRTTVRRLGVLLALAIGLGPLLVPVLAAGGDDAREFDGQVVALAGPLEAAGARLDRDAAPFWLALKAGDGHLYPLVKDPGSRMFFKDEQLRNRPVKLTARLVPHSELLQVLAVRTVIKGRLHEPYYWCDVCKIKRFEPNPCDCCGAPLEFREDPTAN